MAEENAGAPATQQERKLWPWAAVALVLVNIGLIVAALRQDGEQSADKPQSGDAPAKIATERPASAPAVDVRAKLPGRWSRTDGDYLLVVGEVKPDGRVDAKYLNPRPINVAKAELRKTEGVDEFFVELQDAGYPGCTYRLRYDEKRDVLEGVYFQAAMRQTYDVLFERIKENE